MNPIKIFLISSLQRSGQMQVEKFDQFFEQLLFQCFGEELEVREMTFESGGCINQAVKLKTSEGNYFLKWNDQAPEGFFEAEAKGLELLAGTRTLHIPYVIGTGEIQGKPYILMEYVDAARPTSTFWQTFGQQLASLHRHSKDQYGLDHNNFIGKLPQNNEWMAGWVDFFIQKRLNIQLGRAHYHGIIDHEFVSKFKQIYPLLPKLLPDEPPALLHGDLWSGNFKVDQAGNPAVFDPAVYYGSREAELAFTTMFGGFEDTFYTAYQEVFPLEPGFYDRIPIYNLYPLLVHVNLFGTSYLSGIEKTLKSLL